MKRILRARTQMVESMYKYFDADLSESPRAKLYICTLLDPMFKNYKMWPSRQALDQLEEWIKEKPIPYMSHDNFSQGGIFHYWGGRLTGHTHVNQTYPDVIRMWRQFHGCPASGGGMERVFFVAGKQHDAFKKKTMDKTLESTLKASINIKLPTCDDKGVFTDDDTYRKRK